MDLLDGVGRVVGERDGGPARKQKPVSSIASKASLTFFCASRSPCSARKRSLNVKSGGSKLPFPDVIPSTNSDMTVLGDTFAR